MMSPEPSRSELLQRIADLEARLALTREITGRKRAEQAWRESEERLRLFMEDVPASIAMFDREMRYLAVSRRWNVEYLGGAETVLGRSHYELIPECPERWKSAHRRGLAGETVRAEEEMWHLADGSELWFRWEVRPWRSAQGDVGGIVIFTENITERKRAETALRDRERHLISIYNTVRDVVFCLAIEPDGQFRFVSVNATFLRVTGLTANAVFGKTVNEVIPEPSLTMVLRKYRQAVEQKEIVCWEETSDYPTGRLTGEVTIAPVLDERGGCTHLVGSVHDITDRNEVESALRESEERFRTVADCAPVMIWMAGLDKLCNFFNKPWLDFSGRTLEQELGNGWADGVHPEDLDRCLAIYVSSFDARRSFRMEYRLRRADGEYRWVLDTGTPLWRDGEFTGYIGSCIDITEQKHLEEQLRSNHAQLMDSQRLAKVGSWEFDLATQTARWSDEWYRIFGIERDARPEHQTFLSCVHPNDRETVREAEEEAGSTDAPVVVEFRITRPGGEVRFIRAIIEATKNESGAVVRLTGAAQDVTEQVKATELLRESEARLKAAEHMTHVGNWTWDIKTNRVSWSEEMFRITGQVQNREPRYGDIRQIMLAEDTDRAEQWQRSCLVEKRADPIEFRIVRPGGEMRTVVCTAEVQLDRDGSPERMFGACQDVTDARRAQEKSFARQKLESLGTLASGIAHDFNNLLGAVLAQTELAIADVGPESDVNEQLNSIRDVAIRGSEIVRQLMIYAGKESDVVEPVDVSKAVQGMLALLHVAVSRHVALTTDLGESLPVVWARGAQLSQIVMNLIVNASDALGDRDGVIRVTTCQVGLGQSEGLAKALAAGDYVQLEVSDTGCGMSPDTQARIFDPFFTTKFSGRGLGLAVVHGIVRSLRGTIQVVSEVGKGTTFQVLLPCSAPGAHPNDVRSPRLEEFASPGRRTKILLVEDEETLRLATAKMLRKWGLEAIEAASGSAAIDLLRAEAGDIDLMLLDLTMPGASSEEVLAEAEVAQPKMKVVLTSAYNEEAAKGMIGGPLVCGFIRKPFKIADLAQKLRSAWLS